MARPLRLEFAGALYHITSRGDRREAIYESDPDRWAFISVLVNVCDSYNWVCHAYCLMNNHYHLMIETPEGNLSKGMRQLNGVYTQRFNHTHERVGHVFQGRYKAILVEKESYLLELSRYIVLNPVRAGMVLAAKDWPWSSYLATVGDVKGPECLNVDWLLSTFGRRRSQAVGRYRKFIAEGKNKPCPWDSLRNEIYMGSNAFVANTQSLIDGEKELSEVPSRQRRPMPSALGDYEAMSPDRNSAITLAYQGGGYTLKQLGNYFGLHYSTVSGIIKNHKSKT